MNQIFHIEQPLTVFGIARDADFDVERFFDRLLNRIDCHQSRLVITRRRFEQFQRAARLREIVHVALTQPIRFVDRLVHIRDVALQLGINQLFFEHGLRFVLVCRCNVDTIQDIDESWIALPDLQISLLVHRQNHAQISCLQNRLQHI